MFDIKLTDYLETNCKGIDSALNDVERKTFLETLQPHMISGKYQGILLKLLVKLRDAKNVLEIGTFTGYSALCMAEGIEEDGMLITIECDEELATIAQQNFDNSIHRDKIKIIRDDAKEVLEDLLIRHHFDLFFLDADKQSNLWYYKTIKPFLKSNDLILVDNILWKGKVINDNMKDIKTIAARTFNEYITNDESVENIILPIRDGLHLIRKK